MPTREMMTPEGQVMTPEDVEQAVTAIVGVALEAIDDAGREVNEHALAAIKKHVAHRQTEFLLRMMR